MTTKTLKDFLKSIEDYDLIDDVVTCFYYDESCLATFCINSYYGSYEKYKELPKREYFKLFEDHIIRFIFIDENSICVVLEPTESDKEICRKYWEENEKKIRENTNVH